MLVHPARVRSLSQNAPRQGPVVYWMTREQRAADNWGLLHAAALAGQDKAPLGVLFALAPTYPGATARHYDFMLRGLAETEAALRARNIPFFLLPGDPAATVPAFLHQTGAGTCVTDFDPMRIKRHWQGAVAAAFAGALVEVDGHNVVPCLLASSRRDYAAATLRPKIHHRLAEFLEPFPELPHFAAANLDGCDPVDWAAVAGSVTADPAVPPVPPVAGLCPGPAAARAALADFIANRLPGYATRRNDPNAGAVSGLSPYFHFGQLSPQRAALDILAAKDRAPADADAYLEELIIRRELSDNYCHYTPDYDQFSALPDWAQKTLAAHAGDARPYVYEPAAFEAGATHSALWNAAQGQLVRTGRIHGYMRMYWAKKILEWSASPQAAIAIALTLNDRYALDGRDPNGVVGVLWSVGGLHDRPWANRAVYGQVRYMNERGCRRKFDVDAYVARYR
ncbi:Deoxyribodipyrimidine photolyase, type II [Desulfovibrio sp. DV]|uniref:deoxyribodipyrimidine photo-lyase n=1 Tax=Desulfovibrio sp. DV TaxID=1844708 RepID=UPI00094BC359|nr:deoxyribodipyrimidine photo-lyase [Desulfovibrio sp. DV]OLN27789.1 Deoxyribodipyrimidine photolyase, type II [Desulfovibrio sp. DV]